MEMRFINVKYFSYIKTQFGINTCNLLKEFIKLTNQSIMLRVRIRLLRNCIKFKLIPPHLDMCNRYEKKLSFFHNNSRTRLRLLVYEHVRSVLRVEMDDAYRQLAINSKNIFKIQNKIWNSMPWFIANKFFIHQDRNRYIKWSTEINRINKKVEWMISKRNDKTKKDIKPIKYYTNNKQSELTISLNKVTNSSNEIIVTPNDFILEKQLNEEHNNWFVNLSKKMIPNEVRLLLQLGEKFGLPLVDKNKEKTVVEFIKCIEKNIFKEVDGISNHIRNQSVPLIKKLLNKRSNSLGQNEKLVLNWLKQTKSFAIENPDVLFTKADKGNATVAMDLFEYNNKMTEIFSDANTYCIVKKDPSRKLSNQLRSVLSGWLKNEYIDLHTYRKLMVTDGMLPRAYGLPKLHKTGHPLRVIISSLKSPLYNLSCYLHNIIKDSVPQANSSVENSFKLVKNLNGKILEQGYTFASLDVVSLFTNVPIENVYEAISNKWSFIESHTAIPKREFIIALKLILESTFFSFDKVIYKQIYGTPMGSPLSPIVADLVLQDLETKAIKELPLELPLYYRYVDDILFAAPVELLHKISEIFNSLHDRLRFTLEIGVDNRINFLDVTVILKDQKILFDRYEKPTNTGRYINYHSQHPLSQKKSIIYGLIDRTILLSHPQFHEKNLKHVINTLLDNCYPLPFVFSTINTRLKTLSNRITSETNIYNNSNDISTNKDKTTFFTIPYVRSISESFLPITKKYGFNIAFSIPNALNRFIKRGKDKINVMAQNECVYKIKCSNCDMCYVGQTKRQLGTRIKEHISDIKKKSGSLSVVSNHRLENNHEMDWSGVMILDKESSYVKRIISEMVHIKRQHICLNKQSDTDLLSDTYLPIIDVLSPT